jgi:hypothetical protein
LKYPNKECKNCRIQISITIIREISRNRVIAFWEMTVAKTKINITVMAVFVYDQHHIDMRF